MSGVVAVGVAGIDTGASGVNSGKVYVTPAIWEKVAPPKESDIIYHPKKNPKSFAVLIERRKQAELKGKTYDLPSPWTAAPARPGTGSGNEKTLVVTKSPAQQKKIYAATSPWAIVETPHQKNNSGNLIRPKPKKIFAPASSWTTTKSQENSYVVAKLPKPGKIFTFTSPWASAASVRGIPSHTRTVKCPAITPPAPSRIITCELRLVRASDGRVVSQVSTLGSYANIKHLAEAMVGRLEQESSGGSVMMMTLCNRRQTQQGLLVSREMSENVAAALKNISGFKFVRTLNLREILPTEQTLESAQDITAPRFRILLNGARYIVIGGVGLSRLPNVTLKSAATTDDDLH